MGGSGGQRALTCPTILATAWLVLACLASMAPTPWACHSRSTCNRPRSAFRCSLYTSLLFASPTVFVLVKIILAGTGMPLFSRVMGLGSLASAFTGTEFELSGAIGGWAGWPMATVFACSAGSVDPAPRAPRAAGVASGSITP